jgi:hypothetical protein
MSDTYYTASILTTSTTTTQYGTMATVKGSTSSRTRIKRIEIFTDSANATAGGIGLAWSTAVSTATTTAGGTFTAHEGGDSSTIATTIVSTTGTMATNGGAATVFRRFTHSGVGGAGVIWTESELGPLIMALGSTAARGELCFVNLKAATPAIYQINVVVTNAV